MDKAERGFSLKTLLVVVFGAVLAVGGFYVSKNWHPAFITQINEQGIPLDPGKTVSTIGMFLFLFPVLNYFYFKPLSEAIHGRTSDLERTFAEAEELRAEMTKMRADYEARLAQTEAAAREQIQTQIKEAQALRQQLMSEAAAKADDLVKKAQQEIEQEKQRVIGDLRLAVVDLTLAATEKLIGENMDDARNRRLVGEFIAKVEAPSG